MQYKEIISTCYCGDGAGKLEKALSLAAKFGSQITAQSWINSQIERMRAAALLLDTHMAAMDMGKSCGQCAATPGGGCCSVYMGDENNDVLQLLMNILAGVEVQLVRSDGVECCFLAEKGCLLLFKPIFCLNYLCARIQKESRVADLRLLEQKTALLLNEQSVLEQLLIRFLQQQSEE